MLIKITQKKPLKWRERERKKERQIKGRAKKKAKESWAHTHIKYTKDRNNENCLDTIWLCMSIRIIPGGKTEHTYGALSLKIIMAIMQ